MAGKQVTSLKVGLNPGSQTVLYAAWGAPSGVKSGTVVGYKVKWIYYTGVQNAGKNVWFTGDSSDKITVKNSTFTMPENAKIVEFQVTPLRKNKKCGWVGSVKKIQYKKGTAVVPTEIGSAPTLELASSKQTMRAYYTNLNATSLHATHIRFKLWKYTYDANGVKCASTVRGGAVSVPIVNGAAAITYGQASYSYNNKGTTKTVKTSSSGYAGISNNYYYQVQACAYNSANKTYGEYGEFSEPCYTKLSTPKNLKVTAKTSKSVLVTWSSVANANTYNIRYAQSKANLSISGKYQTAQVSPPDKLQLTIDISEGATWWFEVNAANSHDESTTSDWTTPVSVAVGKAPAPPTTWSLTSSVASGDDIELCWTHNSADGSSQNFAHLELLVDGITVEARADSTADDTGLFPYLIFKNPLVVNDEKKDYTSRVIIPTAYNQKITPVENSTAVLASTWSPDGTLTGGDHVVQWRVRTRGAYGEYSDWSIRRTLNIVEKPSIILSEETFIEELTSYPINIEVDANPPTQKALQFFISISSAEEEPYETIIGTGEEILISPGSVIYSANIAPTEGNHLSLQLLPSDVTLDNDKRYRIEISAAMSSGLEASYSFEFVTNFEDDRFVLDVEEFVYDPATFAVYMKPVCYDIVQLYDENNKPVIDSDGIYVTVRSETMSTKATLAVYRRTFDGEFVEIATGIDPTSMATIVDPHPELKAARYRIVATSKITGAIEFEDLDDLDIGEPFILIQWDQSVNDISVMENSDDEMYDPLLGGNNLVLPGNVDITDNNDPDVTMAEYIGRENPVTYYGTHLGTKATWNAQFPKSDTETIGLIRRLARYMGDVYVREPSGIGYWANVKVSYSLTHCEVFVPVTFNITRVEGGA